MATPAEEFEALHRIAATEVKQRGWRGVMRTVRERGSVLVTNHNEAEAVIITAADYADLCERATRGASDRDAVLDNLRRQFDERLSVLNAPDAGERLRSLMQGPTRLHGEVKAGTGY